MIVCNPVVPCPDCGSVQCPRVNVYSSMFGPCCFEIQKEKARLAELESLRARVRELETGLVCQLARQQTMLNS